jgi:manganese transport system permease protein
MNPIDLLIEPLSYTFMTRALIATVIAAVVCALLSCWLVLVGWSLMGDAVSHAVLPGVVLAYVVGAPFAVGAVVFGFLAVGLIGAVRGTSRVKEDAAIGIVFTTLFALGLVLISVTPSQTDLNHIIFGNILGISNADLAQIVVLAAVAFVMLIVKRRDFTLYAFDPTHAHAIGLNPRWLGAVLLGLLALTSVVALQIVGVVLVIAPALSAGCSVTGIFLSYWLDASPGGLVVVMQGAAFTVAYLFAPRHGVARKLLASRRAKTNVSSMSPTAAGTPHRSPTP